MTTVAAGTNTQITLPAGDTVTLTGTGTAQVVPPGASGMLFHQLRTVNSQPISLGPFAVAVLINLTSDIITPLVYVISLPANPANYGQIFSRTTTQLSSPPTAADVAAGQAGATFKNAANGDLQIVNPAGTAFVPIALGNSSHNRAIGVGDSRIDNCFVETYVGNDLRVRQTNNRGIWAWLQGFSGNYWNLVGTAGFPGNTIANVVSRWDNATPGKFFGGTSATTWQYAGVSPYSPDWLFIKIGINSIAVYAALGQTAGLAALVSDSESLIAKIESTRGKAVWVTEPAVGAGTTGYNKAYLGLLKSFNDYLRNRAATSVNLLVVDLFPVSVSPSDTNGNSKTNWNYDNGVHGSSYAALLEAQAIWSAVQAKWGIQKTSWLPVSAAEVYDAVNGTGITNRQGDPLCLQATTANANGLGGSVLPGTGTTGYFGGAGTLGTTYTSSVVAHPSGIGNCIQIDVTSTTQYGVVQIASPRSEALFAGGENVRFGVEIFAQGPGGVALTAAHNLLGVQVHGRIIDSVAFERNTDAFAVITSGNGTTTFADAQPLAGSFNVEAITMPFPVPAGGVGSGRVQTNVNIIMNGAGSCRILLGRFCHLVGGPQG